MEKEKQIYTILVYKDEKFLDKELHFETQSQMHDYMRKNARNLCETPYIFYVIRHCQDTSSIPDMFWHFVPDYLLEKINKQVDLPIEESKVTNKESEIKRSFFRDRLWWGFEEISEPDYEDEDY